MLVYSTFELVRTIPTLTEQLELFRLELETQTSYIEPETFFTLS